jgi:hypothetical protein
MSYDPQDEKARRLKDEGPGLFDNQQRKQLRRCTSALGNAILDFCRVKKTFHMDELQRWVTSKVHSAPSSTDRVLRELRKQGQLDYEVVSRKDSLYKITAIHHKTA